MDAMTLDRWVPSRNEGAAVRCRLFCFPHAGGNAAFYRPLRRFMPPEIDLCPVELPGRAARLGEPPFTSISALAVLLKELAAAVADGNHIYAVIRGSAINNDGADKVSYTASSAAGQARAMLEALLMADVSPDDIAYVECHGTGTVVGDPLEIDALTRAFRTGTDRSGFCAIGSVKSNIGHLEQTAGLAALIKTALALKHRKIPPSLNFRNPNPKIDFAASPFFVNTSCRDWPQGDRPRLAAINSLGLGGTNAFVVLEEPPAATEMVGEPDLTLFTLSARTDAALRASIERHLAWLARDQAPLPDICFTSTSGRMHFPMRFAAVVRSKEQLQEALAMKAANGAAPQPTGERRLAFLFSGQASQYARMGAELYRHQPAFREEVDRCAEIVGDRLGRPLRDVLLCDHADSSLIDETAYTQPALFAVQAGLVALWRSWDIVPDVVLGHSVGEFAAAYCVGVYTLEQALELVAERARLMQALPRDGAMAAIFSDEATVAAAIEQGGRADIAIAALNGPENTVISGARDAVTALIARFAGLGIRCQLLTVSHAFHSPLMRPAADAFARIAAAVPGQRPKITWISTVSATPMHEPPDARYWSDHALNPVRFVDGMRTLGQTGVSDLVEIGPGGTLLTLGAAKSERKRQGMARLAQQARRVERDPDEPWRAPPPRVRHRLGGIQSAIASSSRVTADLSVRAPPLLDRGRCRDATDGLICQWTDRRAFALGDAGCAIREHLQPATFRLSR
jgi:acyl transferase domain-containing protein